MQYITIGEKDFRGGIDQHSSENQIKPTFVEDARNAVFTDTGSIDKRKGYVTFAGNVPLRVVKAEYNATENELCFIFDSSTALDTTIDFSNVRKTPITVFGHLSNPSLNNPSYDFVYAQDKVQYYTAFEADPRITVPANTTLNYTLLGDEHGANTPYLFVGTTKSLSPVTNSNDWFYTDTVKIDTLTYDVNVSIVNGQPTSFPAFIYIKKKPVVPGTTYHHTASSITTVTIPATSHALSNYQILVRCYSSTVNPGYLTEITPDDIIIASNGDVTVNFSSSFTGTIILTAVPPANSVTGTIAAGATASITLTNLDHDFIFADAYLENGTNIERVIPDSIVVDAVTKQATVTFTNSTSSAKTFFIYYETTRLTTNKICVTPYTSYSSSWTDETPQLTVWGLDHEELYPDVAEGSRAGWVTHIDRYESEGERRLVCGLGWNLFTEHPRDLTYLMPLYYGRIRSRTSTQTVVGPAFYDLTDTPTRTRGYIKFNGGGEGWARGVSAIYDSSNNGWTKITLSCPSISVVGTLSTIIQSGPFISDFLTVQDAPLPEHNGTYRIRQVNLIANGLEIWIQNPNITSSDFNVSDAGMLCGIFTDVVHIQTGTNVFLPDDIILSNGIPDDRLFQVIQSETATTIRIKNVFSEFTFLSGLALTGKRPKARMVAIRNLNGSAPLPQNFRFLKGDCVALADYTRRIRLLSAYPQDDETVSITGNGTKATVTMTSTARYNVGSYIMIYFGPFCGIHKITDIVDATKLKFEHSHVGTVSATLAGKCIVFDEDVPNYEDKSDSSNTISVEERWVPIEAPVDTFTSTPVTTPKYFKEEGYTSQPFMRSVMVSDNLYLTNSKDPVFKYDGFSLYRAGLPRWQPGQFITIANEGTTGSISVPKIVTTNTCQNGAGDAFIKTGLGQEKLFFVGDLVKYSGNNEIYTITKIEADSTNGIITLDRSIPTAYTAQTLSKVYQYKYYFRLNLIDANRNIIGSAVTNPDNFRVYVANNVDIRIKLIGFPAWDIYDYDRIELVVYRTKLNGAIFYRIKNVKVDFDTDAGYILVQDFESDDTLVDDLIRDPVNAAARPGSLALGIKPPVRSKYITSTGNRLILGNIKSDPYIDITFLQKPNAPLTRFSFSGHKFTLRRANTITSSITNMIDVVNYHFVSSGDVSISGITTDVVNKTFTVTVSSTSGISPGHWAYLFRKAAPHANQQLTFAGWFQVHSVPPGGTTLVFKMKDVPASLTFAEHVDRIVFAPDKRDVPIWLGTTSDRDYNFGMVNGNASSPRVATFRLASAINASMRQVDTTLSAFANFKPWIIANAGDEFGADPRIILEQPKVEGFVFEIEFPSGTLPYEIFANRLRRSPGAQVSAIVEVKPSRILASIPSFPEIFDNPFAEDASASMSAIDINAADGQEITGITTFFGDSVFGAGQKFGAVVVFKTHSIYVCDVNSRSVQKVESQGIGCTIPFSITATRNGIIFANESGIYRLTRQLTVQYVGQMVERIWQSCVKDDVLHVIQGHHYAVERQYKISVPDKGSKTPSLVLVYDHTAEEQRNIGSWSVYDNHPAIGWANYGELAAFASTKGRVFMLRNAGDNTDYRDDNKAITMYVNFRPMDFGESGIRKRCLHMLVHFKNYTVDMTGTKAFFSLDLDSDFNPLDEFVVDTPYPLTMLGDLSFKKVSSIRFSFPRDRFIYLQPRIVNDKIDEPVTITSIDYRVIGLTSKGTPEAGDTKREG